MMIKSVLSEVSIVVDGPKFLYLVWFKGAETWKEIIDDQTDKCFIRVSRHSCSTASHTAKGRSKDDPQIPTEQKEAKTPNFQTE